MGLPSVGSLACDVAAIKSVLSVQCATVRNEYTNDVNRFKEEFGKGRATEVVLLNMTGEPIILVDRVDFAGNAWKYPVPGIVAPEKGSYFLHVGKLGFMGKSSGGLSYDVGRLGLRVDFMWSNPLCGANWVVAEFVRSDDDPREWNAWREQVLNEETGPLLDFDSDVIGDTVCSAGIAQTFTSVCELTLYSYSKVVRHLPN